MDSCRAFQASRAALQHHFPVERATRVRAGLPPSGCGHIKGVEQMNYTNPKYYVSDELEDKFAELLKVSDGYALYSLERDYLLAECKAVRQKSGWEWEPNK